MVSFGSMKLQVKRLREGAVGKTPDMLCSYDHSRRRSKKVLSLHFKTKTSVAVSGKLDMCLLKMEDPREYIYLMPEKSKIERPWLEVLPTGSRVTNSGCALGESCTLANSGKRHLLLEPWKERLDSE